MTQILRMGTTGENTVIAQYQGEVGKSSDLKIDAAITDHEVLYVLFLATSSREYISVRKELMQVFFLLKNCVIHTVISFMINLCD